MKTANKELIIILPEDIENIPVRIIYDKKEKELSLKIISYPQRGNAHQESEKLHAAVYNQNQYEHIPMCNILWIEANGSYCDVYTANNKKITLSYSLSHIQKALPADIFIRIHRSYLVNIDNIKCISGNSVIVGNKFLKIGKIYRQKVFDRFIFLGVRNRPKANTKLESDN